MKALALAAVATLGLAACAPKAPEPMKISEVNVTADLEAVGSRQAATYWKNLGTDLETALATEFVGRIDPLGNVVNVDIDELSLANAMATGLGPDDARLAGRVTVESPDGRAISSYNVTATSSQAATYLPQGGTAVPPASSEFYSAVVQAFARGTAEVVLGAGS